MAVVWQIAHLHVVDVLTHIRGDFLGGLLRSNVPCLQDASIGCSVDGIQALPLQPLQSVLEKNWVRIGALTCMSRTDPETPTWGG